MFEKQSPFTYKKATEYTMPTVFAFYKELEMKRLKKVELKIAEQF